MSRSLKKSYYIQHSLLDKVQRSKDLNLKNPIKTWSRSSVIIPFFVGLVFEVHNGKKFSKVYISEDMVGHKLGEFSHTRFFKKHPNTGNIKKPVNK
jgi:small subunit ribosomal protein S19